MSRVVVAIHQPNFFPWLGFFDKLHRADVFVMLDDAQFAKSGAGTWSNRVRLLLNGAAAWVTMPIRRDFQGVRRVNEMQIDDGQPWRGKMLRTISTHYARAPFFREMFPLVEQWAGHQTSSLCDYNVAGIHGMCDAMGLDRSRVVLSSSLGVEDRATDRLIAIVQRVGGTAYLSGDGAGGYQEAEKFAAAGIELELQQFQPSPYPQGGTADFVPGLSTLDALLRCGPDGAAALLRRIT